MNELFIRVSTNSEYGRGHLKRCLYIRNYIKLKVTWYIDNKKNDLRKFLPSHDKVIVEKKSSSVSCLKNKSHKKKILLIDNYQISNKVKEYLMNYFQVISIEDELKFLKISMVICHQPYNFISNNKRENLYGIKYAPINIDYKKKVNFKNNTNILVCMGAYDSKKITVNIIRAILEIEKITDNKFNTRILITSNFKEIKLCKKLIQSNKNFELIINKNNIYKYIYESDIAIGAPGISHLERLYLGLPSILIAQNQRQEGIVKGWYKINCALKAKNSIKSISYNIIKLLNNYELRKKIALNGKKNIDGNGAKRIAKKINSL